MPVGEASTASAPPVTSPSARKRARVSPPAPPVSSSSVTSMTAPSPFDDQIQAALSGLDDDENDSGSLGWSDLEKELLRKLKGKEREIDSLVETIADPSLRLLPTPIFFPPPPPSSASSIKPKPKAPPPPNPNAISAGPPKPAQEVLVSHLKALQKDNALLRSLLATPTQAGGQKIDLERVVDRLRTLTRENEEFEARIEALGAEGGAGGGAEQEEELRQGMEDCHQTIVALDADLTSAQSTITTLQATLDQYLIQCGPLPSPASPVVPAAPTRHKSPPRAPRGLGGGGGSRGQPPSGPRGGGGRGGRGGGGAGGGSRTGRRDEREGSRDLAKRLGMGRRED